MNKARQIVTWDADTNCYKVSWISKKELIVNHGQRRADKMWRDQCFKGTYKIFPEFAHPVIKGQTLVSWMEISWSWHDARAYWRQFPQANMEPMKADESSHKHIRRTLKNLIFIPECAPTEM